MTWCQGMTLSMKGQGRDKEWMVRGGRLLKGWKGEDGTRGGPDLNGKNQTRHGEEVSAGVICPILQTSPPPDTSGVSVSDTATVFTGATTAECAPLSPLSCNPLDGSSHQSTANTRSMASPRRSGTRRRGCFVRHLEKRRRDPLSPSAS